MELTHYDPPGAPAPIGGYSQAVELTSAERLLFVSGQIPEDPRTRVPEGFEAQCRQVWRNLLSVLDAADLGVSDLVKVTTFLTDPSQAEVNGRIRREVLPDGVRPALTVIVAGTLESSWLLEIEAIAAR